MEDSEAEGDSERATYSFVSEKTTAITYDVVLDKPYFHNIHAVRDQGEIDLGRVRQELLAVDITNGADTIDETLGERG